MVSDPAAIRHRAEMSVVLTLPSVHTRDIDNLTALLTDAINNGASVGYVLPVDHNMINAYWRATADEVSASSIALFAIRKDEHIVASAQLAFCGKPNGRHRAEVQKVLVHSAHRRKGFGAMLMHAVERHAFGCGRTLLVLDTESDSAGQRLYEATGYTAAGIIPRFAIGNAGGFVPTTYMYKILDRRA